MNEPPSSTTSCDERRSSSSSTMQLTPSASASATLIGESKLEKFRPLLECCACKKLVIPKRAKLLSCLHTMCGPCEISADKCDGQVSCATCDQKSRIEEIVDHYVVRANYLTLTLCTSCTDNLIAEYKCEQCDDDICHACALAHRRVRMTKDHVLKPFNSLDNCEFCIIHPNCELDRMCVNCSICVCIDCCAIGKHVGHVVQSLKTIITNAENDSKTFVEKLLKCSNEAQDDAKFAERILQQLDESEQREKTILLNILQEVEREYQLSRAPFANLKSTVERFIANANHVDLFVEAMNDCRSQTSKQAAQSVAKNAFKSISDQFTHIKQLKEAADVQVVSKPRLNRVNNELIIEPHQQPSKLIQETVERVASCPHPSPVQLRQRSASGTSACITPPARLPDQRQSSSSNLDAGVSRVRYTPPQVPVQQPVLSNTQPQVSIRPPSTIPIYAVPQYQMFSATQLAELQRQYHQQQQVAMQNAENERNLQTTAANNGAPMTVFNQQRPLFHPPPQGADVLQMQQILQQQMQQQQFQTQQHQNYIIQQLRFAQKQQQMQKQQELQPPCRGRPPSYQQPPVMQQTYQASGAQPAYQTAAAQRYFQPNPSQQQQMPVDSRGYIQTVSATAASMQYRQHCVAPANQTVSDNFDRVVQQQYSEGNTNEVHGIQHQSSNAYTAVSHEQLVHTTLKRTLESSTVAENDKSTKGRKRGRKETVPAKVSNEKTVEPNDVDNRGIVPAIETLSIDIGQFVHDYSDHNYLNSLSSNSNEPSSNLFPNLVAEPVSDESPLQASSNLNTPNVSPVPEAALFTEPGAVAKVEQTVNRTKGTTICDNSRDAPMVAPVSRPKARKTMPTPSSLAAGVSILPSEEKQNVATEINALITDAASKEIIVVDLASSFNDFVPVSKLPDQPTTNNEQSTCTQRATPDANSVTTTTHEENVESLDEDRWDDNCSVCQEDNGEMLQCQVHDCLRVYHRHHHIPEYEHIPSHFVCGLCVNVLEFKKAEDEVPYAQRISKAMTLFELKVCEFILLKLYCHSESLRFHFIEKDFYKNVKTTHMDFLAIRTKLRNNKYNSVEDFLIDLNQVFMNYSLVHGAGSSEEAVGQEYRQMVLEYLPSVADLVKLSR